ncbi:exonuclease domain-containing protein [Candidatus Aalborgicola defluviihabitans]|uniref:exonuclease domain-containing protein n=1 Tax=Candidatus Aalborgicola defluviihabitans TaxID=3386187 RepID=UPI0039B8E84B
MSGRVGPYCVFARDVRARNRCSVVTHGKAYGPPHLLWHDYETFGATPRRDRPAQFAAIRTDAELNQLGEPLMLYCQPAPDFLAPTQRPARL